MRLLNLLLTLASVNVLIITVERFSFTTGILLEPYKFIRLHELLQGPVFLTISVILSFLTLKIVSDNFKSLNSKAGLILGTLFAAGIYLYGMGEGWHEVASFTFNQYCDTKNFSDNLCGGLFINDYYTGNILFFIGGILLNSALMFLEKMNPSKAFNSKDMAILSVNSVIYAFTFFAYAGFDRVLIGLYSTLILMLISLYVFAKIKNKFRNYPYITYSVLAYTVASIASILVRLR